MAQSIESQSPIQQRDLSFHVQAWSRDAGGAYDCVNLIDKMAQVTGCNYVHERAEAYLNATSVPHLGDASITLYQTVQELRRERAVTWHKAFDAAHALFDFNSAVLYTRAFFSKNAKTILRFSSVFDLLFDATGLASSICQYREAYRQLQKKQVLSVPMQKSLRDQKNNAMIDLIRTVAAVAVSVLSVSLLLWNAAIASSVILVCGLIGVSMSILGYYHKNYWCNGFTAVSITKS